MALKHTNRKGQCYYVLQGLTKTGKAKYYCSRKDEGTGVDELPSDFEIYEHPESAIVTVRRVKPSMLLPYEREFLDAQVRKFAGIEYFVIDQVADSLLVYVSDCNQDEVDETLERLMGPSGRLSESTRRRMMENARYAPMFRFTLTDADERLFQLERWCYRGRIDGWIPLCAGNRPLDELAADYLPHLGQESFFDLI